MPSGLDNAKPVPDMLNERPVVDYRQRLIARAESQVGTPVGDKYYREAAPIYEPKDWAAKSYCQIFLVWCCRSVGLPQPLWEDGGGNFFPTLRRISRDEAQPGDFTCLPKTKYGKWVWHGALWLRSEGHRDCTIDGNTSKGVAKKRRDIRIYDPRPLYYSAQSLVDAALERDRTPAEKPV